VVTKPQRGYLEVGQSLAELTNPGGRAPRAVTVSDAS
jgi:hypothetical protein